jgi:hemoglobin-like flavoprotein
MSIEQEAKDLVQSSFQAVLSQPSSKGGLTDIFYERFFELSPEVKKYFEDADMFVLGKALAGIIVVMVKGLDDLDSLVPKLIALGKRHAIYGVEERHYTQVGPSLLYAMEKVLGKELPKVRESKERQRVCVCAV